MSKNLTSLIIINLLVAFIICCCCYAETEENLKQTKETKVETDFLKLNRVKRQFGQFGGGGGGGFGFNNFNNGFGGNNFNGGFGGPRRRGQRPPPGVVGNNIPIFPNDNGNFAGNPGSNELIFSRPDNSGANGGGGAGNIAVTTPATFVSNGLNGQNNNVNSNQVVFINNRPTIATIAPFVARTTPSSQYLTCFNGCATTPEYNPICGSDMELYFNEQKFNCARRCGADIQIVRRGSCQGLFPMMRG